MSQWIANICSTWILPQTIKEAFTISFLFLWIWTPSVHLKFSSLTDLSPDSSFVFYFLLFFEWTAQVFCPFRFNVFCLFVFPFFSFHASSLLLFFFFFRMVLSFFFYLKIFSKHFPGTTALASYPDHTCNTHITLWNQKNVFIAQVSLV